VGANMDEIIHLFGQNSQYETDEERYVHEGMIEGPELQTITNALASGNDVEFVLSDFGPMKVNV
jgi:hypothetical protein